MHDGRLFHLERQITANLGDRIAHFLRRGLHVLVEVEVHRDLGDTVAHARLELVHAGDARDAVFNGVEHLTLHAFGRCARVHERDADDGELHVRQLIGLEAGQRERAEPGYGQHRRDRDDRSLDGEIGDEHRVVLSERWES